MRQLRKVCIDRGLIGVGHVLIIWAELETEAAQDAHKMASQSVLKELRLDESAFPCTALEGDWL